MSEPRGRVPVVAERLWVTRTTELVATLERNGDDQLRLIYQPDLVKSRAELPVISTSLPVREAPYTQSELLPFFEGLLPEGSARDRLAVRLRLEPNDVFGFLREIGRDCAGAYSIVPEGTDLEAARHEGVEWLNADQLAETVSELATRPLAVEPGEDIRISLAGAQDKMAVVRDGERIGLPRGTTPSTHILKPSSSERRGRRGRELAYPGLVANEGFCMTLARESGIAAPDVSVIDIGGDPALLISRYDRASRNAQVERIHQEDLCQALGVPGRLKYEKDGGPDAGRYVSLLNRWSVDVADDVPELIDRIAFNYLIGNSDAHAKNFSILHQDGVRLAPAYDLLSTHVYGHLTKDMATSINGMFDPRAIQPVHWRKEMAKLDLSVRLYASRLARLADRVEERLSAAVSWIETHSLANRQIERIIALVHERADVLRGIEGD
ncbi:type II toxin-antitoxin system HipA family toxin [bacterium]|nr:MAG: type II toxin-antitoxin system HipA family toxin [bacterium]